MSSQSSDDQPTEDELKNLKRVADDIPTAVWLMALVSLSERFTYYGISAPFQNYIQNPFDDPLRPGALNLGQATATRLNNVFSLFVYVTPVGAAIIADSWLGKYKTLLYSTIIYLLGCIILVATSFPSAIKANAGLPGLIVAMIIIGSGLGGVKACVSPFMADQYKNVKMRVKTTKRGDRVIVDRDLTIKAIYSLYYWCINFGCLSGLATTYIERDVSFWAAYLFPTCVLLVALAGLIFGRHKFVDHPPTGSILPSTLRAFSYAAKAGFSMDAAKPEYQQQQHNRLVPWDEKFINELKDGLMACRVFAMFPILWLCHSQVITNMISQAGQMNTYGVPNDIWMNLNPISVIVFLPLVQKLLYPFLRKCNVRFGSISRITTGLVLEAAALGYAAIVQRLIYDSPPCYSAPLKCPASPDGIKPNDISVLVQVPVYLIDGIAEIFFDVTSQEYAYTHAPSSMKSLIQAILVLTSALGAALGIALSPFYTNPQILWLYTGLAAVMFATAVVFYICFRRYDRFGNREKSIEEEKAAVVPVNEDVPGMEEQSAEKGHRIS